MKVNKYRKKPITIEAIQFTKESLEDVRNWLGKDCIESNSKTMELLINTLEGTMKASENDYIIKGIKGEFYPCKPDIFEQTYDAVVIYRGL